MKVLLTFFLGVGLPLAVSANVEPYPATPVNLQSFRNNTIPNIALIVDNTATMKSRIHRRATTAESAQYRLKPRRLDAVKDAALQILDNYYNDFNWSLFVINDGYRDMHWGYDNDPKGSGYIEVERNATSKQVTSGEVSFLSAFDKRDRPVLIPASGYLGKDYTFRYYNSLLSDVLGVQLHEESFEYLRDRFGVRYDDKSWNSPYGRQSRRWTKNQGYQLIVPLSDKLDRTFDNATHLKQLRAGLKSIAPQTGYLQYVYGQAVEYMADHVDYRCQDSFVIVLTDGNTITNSYNRRAAEKYAHKEHPRLDYEKDKDGFFFNQEDFPDQHIRSYAIGIGTNAGKFSRFENYGKGRAVTVKDSDEILEIMEEFIQDMQPENVFRTVTPATSYIETNTGTTLQANITTDGNDWSSSLSFSYLDGSRSGLKANYFVKDNYISRDDFETTKEYQEALLENEFAEQHEAVVYGNTSKGLLNFSELAKQDDLINWVIAGRKKDSNTVYRNRSIELKSEKRFLGDSFNNMLAMVGEPDKTIQAPKYMVLGTNDGIFKIYHPNPLYGSEYKLKDDETGKEELVVDHNPYAYAFGYIPGTARKNNGNTVLDTLKIRANEGYGKSNLPSLEHQYTMNGQLMYRTTDRGQTFIVATLGQGARGAFALNISGNDHVKRYQAIGLDADKADWGSSVALWDTSSNNFGNASSADNRGVGYITAPPSIGRIALVRRGGIPDLSYDVRYIAALPTGNHGDDIGPTLYIHDALGANVALDANVKAGKPGTLIQKITYNDWQLEHASSLSGVTLVDLDFDGVVDVGYAGDRNGNLYRFDFRGNTPSDWRVHLLYKGDSKQPIKNAPQVSRYGGQTTVIFGTGSLVYGSDYDSPQQQGLFGIIDPLMIDKTYTKEDLVEQTLTEINDKRVVTNHAIGPKKGGWYINMPKNRSESVFGSPQVAYGTVYFRTHIVDNDVIPNDEWKCFRSLTGPTTWIMQINAKTGGMLTSKDSYVISMGPDVAGKRIPNFIASGDIIYIGESSSMSQDGVMKSGSEKDINLDASKSSRVPRNPVYKNPKEDKVDAYWTGIPGMDGKLHIPDQDREHNVGRIYIRHF